MKTIKLKLFILALVCGIFISNGFAQEMPKTQKDLQRFVGDWRCKDAKIIMGGKTFTIDYHFNVKPAIDGAGLVADEFFDHPELGKMRGLNMVNYDPGTAEIHWYSIDNQGTCHDHICTWIDNDHFYFQVQGLNKGKPYTEKANCDFMPDGKMNFKIVTEEDGKVVSSGSGVFSK